MRDLFGHDPRRAEFPHVGPGARKSDPATSHEAAVRDPLRRTTDRFRALVMHGEHRDGLTDFELAALMKRQQTSAGKRRGELRDLGYVEPTEARRDAPSGSPAMVWRITQEGIALLQEGMRFLRPTE